MTPGPARYRGRFAPSPTGPLHFGSLIAAVASYLQARAHDGEWLLRIEDIDPPREPPGSDRRIVAALDAYGFEWDGPVFYQSTFAPRHHALVEALVRAGKAYPCSCSRRDLADAPRGPLGVIYPGTCRAGCVPGETAIRLKTTDEPIVFEDILQGRQCQKLASESGDFVIRRRDGLIAYHMAVVVDDHDQGITEVVRGIDLLESTPRHIWLQRQLGFATPVYLHIPVAINADGQKLSKLTGAAAIDIDNPAPGLLCALTALGQRPPGDLAGAGLADIWRWAIGHWDPAPLARRREIPAASFGFG